VVGLVAEEGSGDDGGFPRESPSFLFARKDRGLWSGGPTCRPMTKRRRSAGLMRLRTGIMRLGHRRRRGQ
jgi:hypothetical protein